MKSSRKKVGVLAASGLAALSLLAGGVTTANWSDGVSLSGAQITSGNLDVEKIGELNWSEKSLDSTNFNGLVELPYYRISPGDTIQGRQKLDVALQGKNMRSKFKVYTRQLQGDLYSPENGVSANFVVLDENGFIVVPSTPFGVDTQEIILLPENVTPEVDGVEDYVFIVTVSFDENTPDQVRTQVAADLGSIDFRIEQIRENIGQPVERVQPVSYELAARTQTPEEVIFSGGVANFTHIIENTGNAPINNIEIRSEFGTTEAVDTLGAGESVKLSINIPDLESTTEPTFEFYGETEAGVVKLDETTKRVVVKNHSVSVVRTSTTSTDPDTGINSITVYHEITNTGDDPVTDMVVRSENLPDSTIQGSINPGETVTLSTQIPTAYWFGNRYIEFDVYGNSAGEENILLSRSTTPILSGALSEPSDRVAMGYNHSCFIVNGGEVWCQGRNVEGQLGDGTNTNSYTPVRAGTIDDAIKLEAGSYNTFAVTATGEMWAWGDNDNGELGVGDNRNHNKPRKVGISGIQKVSASGSNNHSAVMLDNGNVMVTGHGDFIGTANKDSTVYRLPSKEFENVRDVEVGGTNNTYVIANDGTVWGTGRRNYKALNDGSNVREYKWVRIGNHTDALEIYGRNRGGAYRTVSGEMYGWGYDKNGQMGLGDVSTYGRYLTRLPHYEDVAHVEFGPYHTVMAKKDGTVWTNGFGNDAQLSGDPVRDQPTPKKVAGINDAIAVQTGSYSSMAITPTQRYAWGYNRYSGLGTSSRRGALRDPLVVEVR